jgi:hypothetical protein
MIGRPDNRFRFFGNHARASLPDKVLSAGVAELVDALDLGSSDESCGGSSPSARTILSTTPGEVPHVPALKGVFA